MEDPQSRESYRVLIEPTSHPPSYECVQFRDGALSIVRAHALPPCLT
jgi:hypothetical protein